MTCVQTSSCSEAYARKPEPERKEEKRTFQPDISPARSNETPAQVAFRRFLKKHVGRAHNLTVSGPRLAELARIDWPRLAKLMDENTDTRLSADEMFRLARAFDEVDDGLGAALLTAMGAGHGYATHRIERGEPDVLRSAACASEYAAAVCGTTTAAAPTAAQAETVLTRLDRAVTAMLAARGMYAKRRGS